MIKLWKDLEAFRWTRSFGVVFFLLLSCGVNTYLYLNPSGSVPEPVLFWGNLLVLGLLGWRHFLDALRIFYKGGERSLSGFAILFLIFWSAYQWSMSADFYSEIFPWLISALAVLSFSQLFEFVETLATQRLSRLLHQSTQSFGSAYTEKIENSVTKFFAEDSPGLIRMRSASWGWSVFAIFLGAASVWWWRNEGHSSNQLVSIFAANAAVASPRLFSSLVRLSLLKGLHASFKHSALVTQADVFDRLGEITVLAFDKTGTLTLGQPQVSRVMSLENVSHKEVMQLAASLEDQVDHPLARAIAIKAKEEGLKCFEYQEREIALGKGVKANLIRDGKKVSAAVGNLMWMYENGIETTQIPESLRWEAEGTECSVVWLLVDGKILGSIFLDDEISPEAFDTVRFFEDEGFEVGLITGDTEFAAQRLSKKLRLKFHHYGVTASEKATIVKRLSEKKKKGFDFLFPKVAFVGDGRNERPALEASHVGIAMGMHPSVWESGARVILLENSLPRLRELFEGVRKVASGFSQLSLGVTAYHLIAFALINYVWPQFLNANPDPGVSAILGSLFSIVCIVGLGRPSK